MPACDSTHSRAVSQDLPKLDADGRDTGEVASGLGTLVHVERVVAAPGNDREAERQRPDIAPGELRALQARRPDRRDQSPASRCHGGDHV